MDNVKVTDNTKAYIEAMEAASERILEAIGIEVERAAKRELENAPRRIDTGNLRNSITHAVDMSEDCVYVGTNVEYGIYVHEGTVRMTPNRFLRNAVEKNEGAIKEYIEKELKAATSNITTVSNDIG